MFLDRTVGSLNDPLNGQSWGPSAVLGLMLRRMERYAEMGLARSDRVFFHHGNTLEFFVETASEPKCCCLALRLPFAFFLL